MVIKFLSTLLDSIFDKRFFLGTLDTELHAVHELILYIVRFE